MSSNAHAGKVNVGEARFSRKATDSIRYDATRIDCDRGTAGHFSYRETFTKNRTVMCGQLTMGRLSRSGTIYSYKRTKDSGYSQAKRSDIAVTHYSYQRSQESKGDKKMHLWAKDIWLNQGSRIQKQSNSLPFVVAAASQAPQNVDLPTVLSKKKKKPKPSVKQATKKKFETRPLERILGEPENGLPVKRLIPIAYDVLEGKSILTKGVAILLKTYPVWACRFCTELHVDLIGHSLPTCLGPKKDQRHNLHDWTKATINDILLPVEAYHLKDRLALPMVHDQRFDFARISAIEELCIQAGVDIPEYPTRRYSESIQSPIKNTEGDANSMGQEVVKQPQEALMMGEDDVMQSRVNEPAGCQESENQVGEDHVDGGESLVESRKYSSSNEERIPLGDLTTEDDLQTVAKKTLQAWEKMRAGAKKLKTKYRVLVCGYCPEVHVGPRGHKAQICGAFKHQWRNGQHGWQSASIDDLLPPQYVWHLRDRDGPPLHKALLRFHGKAPAVVELCVQAGAPIPDRDKPLMRLDVVVPRIEELEYVI
ncbi:unnamed protein product [Calypogeia fissa]